MEKLVSNGLPKIKKQHAKLLISITVGLVLISVIIFVASRTIGSDNNLITNINENQSAANINILEGAPRVEKFGRISRTINESEEVSKGDVIVTDGISRALIVFSNNSSIVIDTNSRIEIKNITTGEQPAIEIYQIKGSIFVRGETGVEENLKVIVSTDISTLEFVEARVKASISDDSYKIESRKGVLDLTTKQGTDTIGEYELEEAASLEITIAEIDKYTSEFIDENVTYTAGDDDTYWQKLIDCIDYKISDILSQGNFEKKNYLKNKLNEITTCPKDIKDENFDKLNNEKLSEAEAAAAKQAIEEKKTPPKISAIDDSGSISKDLTELDKISCTWSATGEDIKGYEYSIGTSKGATDTKTWTAITDLSVVETNLGMVYGQSYYCNVKAESPYGTSEVKSSDGVIFDDSVISSVTATASFPGPITGNVNWSEYYDLEDYLVKVYIKNSAGKYSDATAWVDSLTWHETDITPNGSDTIDWETTTDFTQASTEYDGTTLYIQVENTVTGKIYQTTKTL